MFAGIWLGAMIANTLAFFRGATFGERLLVCLVTPMAWDAFLYEHFPVFPIPIPGITAVRTKDFKYIHYQKGTWGDQLFDLRKDPRELLNIIGTKAGKEALPGLQKSLEQLKEETRYRFFTHTTVLLQQRVYNERSWPR